ncbi:hypothetical protein [Salipiger abyssi]|uniref:hypothetical protein n=1 Tax=Salipiger abyssi TaxID=1250539 RepID=UPI001A9067FB|nr:hypothetical protein [Salipiger abyssi]MBN9887401.1 hypothetical protein [Salipiger abyssi]
MKLVFTALYGFCLILFWLDRNRNSAVRRIINEANAALLRLLENVFRKGLFLVSEQRSWAAVRALFGSFLRPGRQLRRAALWSLAFLVLSISGFELNAHLLRNQPVPQTDHLTSTVRVIRDFASARNCLVVTGNVPLCREAGFLILDTASLTANLQSMGPYWSSDMDFSTGDTDDLETSIFLLGLGEEIARTHLSLVLAEGDAYLGLSSELSTSILKRSGWFTSAFYATVLLPSLYLSCLITTALIYFSKEIRLDRDIYRGGIILGSALLDFAFCVVLFFVVTAIIYFLGPILTHLTERLYESYLFPENLRPQFTHYVKDVFAPRVLDYYAQHGTALADPWRTLFNALDEGLSANASDAVVNAPQARSLFGDMTLSTTPISATLSMQPTFFKTLVATGGLVISDAATILRGFWSYIPIYSAIRNWMILITLLPLLLHIAIVAANLFYAAAMLFVTRPLIELTRVASETSATKFYGGALAFTLGVLGIWIL